MVNFVFTRKIISEAVGRWHWCGAVDAKLRAAGSRGLHVFDFTWSPGDDAARLIMGMLWNGDDELFALCRRELFTAVVGDVMDRMGLLHQFLPPYLRPLRDDMVVIGRAMPVLEADAFEEQSSGGRGPLGRKPFGLMFEALDDLKRNEVYVCAGASPRYALWGEMMSARAMRLGAAGAVLDGYSRDTRGVLAMNFPTFSMGRYAQDQGPRGKVIDFRMPIEIGGVRIQPGDVLFGDLDGVLVVPKVGEVEAFTRALEKARAEKKVKRAIEQGMSACDAWERFGIM